MLNWDETDVLTVLEVLPETEQDGIYHKYVSEKDGVRLTIIIYPYDGDVKFELKNISTDADLFSMQLIDCECVLRRKEESMEYLEFAPSKCFGSRYDGQETVPYGVRVAVNPGISLSLYG